MLLQILEVVRIILHEVRHLCSMAKPMVRVDVMRAVFVMVVGAVQQAAASEAAAKAVVAEAGVEAGWARGRRDLGEPSWLPRIDVRKRAAHKRFIDHSLAPHPTCV